MGRLCIFIGGVIPHKSPHITCTPLCLLVSLLEPKQTQTEARVGCACSTMQEKKHASGAVLHLPSRNTNCDPMSDAWNVDIPGKVKKLVKVRSLCQHHFATVVSYFTHDAMSQKS